MSRQVPGQPIRRYRSCRTRTRRAARSASREQGQAPARTGSIARPAASPAADRPRPPTEARHVRRGPSAVVGQWERWLELRKFLRGQSPGQSGGGRCRGRNAMRGTIPVPEYDEAAPTSLPGASTLRRAGSNTAPAANTLLAGKNTPRVRTTTAATRRSTGRGAGRKTLGATAVAAAFAADPGGRRPRLAGGAGPQESLSRPASRSRCQPCGCARRGGRACSGRTAPARRRSST